MNKTKKILACALALMMTCGITACEESSAGTSTSGNGPQVNVPVAGTTTAATSVTTVDPDELAATDDTAKELDTSSFTPSGDAGVVKFLGYYDITSDQKGDEQCKIFQGEQYNGKIEVISASSGSAYYDKLATMIAADDSPDLLTFEPLAFPYGVSKNMFESLDAHINVDDPLWTEMKPMIDEYAYNGQHYYVPHRIVTRYALNYNRKTVEEAGLKDPYELYMAGEWTWDTWRQMMIDFCNLDEENIGLYATSTMLECFINTTGTTVIDVAPDGTISNNLNNPNITRSIEYLAEMGRSGLLYPDSHPHGDWVSPQVWATCSDKLLFLSMEPEWTYIAATEEIQNPSGVDNDIFGTPSDFTFVPYPRDPQADAYYMCSNTFGYMVPKGAKNIKGSVEFIYCNRLYETDQNIIDQVKNDHIAPEKITYTAGKYEGREKWQITWDETSYDLWRDMCSAENFTFIIDDMYGFGDELSVPITDAIYNSTFVDGSWTQSSSEIAPVVEAVLAEYA